MVIALIVMMLTSLLVPVNAAGGNKTITIENASGHEFTAYQIFGGTLSGAILSDVTWGNGINTENFLTSLKDSTYFGTRFDNCTDAASVAAIMQSGINSTWIEADTIQFAKLAADHKSGTTMGVGAPSGNDFIISGLEPGYYLVIDTTANLQNDAYSRYMIQVSNNATVGIKKDTPTISKAVSRAMQSGYANHINAASGETVYFKLTATLHSRIGDYDQYYLEFVDKIPAGLSFNRIEALIVNEEFTSAKYLYTEPSITSNVTGTTIGANVTSETNGNEVKLKVNDAKATIKTFTGAEAISTDTVTIIYSANLKSDNSVTFGKAGNINTAYLKYTNTPYAGANYNTNTSNTNSVSATVYTHKMEIAKVDSASGTALTGATFKIYYNPGDNNMKWAVATNVDGVYYVTGTTNDETQATLLECDSAGKIVIAGLNTREYHIKEITPPEGYNKIQTAQTVTIIQEGTNFKASHTGTFTTASYNSDGTIINVVIRNTSGTTLPTTGGMGTTVFYIVGLVLVLGAAVLLISRRRKRSEG